MISWMGKRVYRFLSSTSIAGHLVSALVNFSLNLNAVRLYKKMFKDTCPARSCELHSPFGTQLTPPAPPPDPTSAQRRCTGA